MNNAIAFSDIASPEPYPKLYWHDTFDGQFRYLGWQAWFETVNGLKRCGEILKIGPTRMSKAWPKGLRGTMIQDAEFLAKAIK